MADSSYLMSGKVAEKHKGYWDRMDRIKRSSVAKADEAAEKEKCIRTGSTPVR